MPSIGTMLKQCAGLVGTEDLNAWENLFVSDMLDKSNNGAVTATLTERQVTAVHNIWKKHFAG